MKQRFVTAVIALAVLVCVIFLLPTAAAEIAIGAVLLAGAWEWSGFLKPPKIAARISYVLLLGLLFVLVSTVLRAGAQTIMLVSLLWWAAAFAWMLKYPTPIPGLVSWLAGIFVLVPLFVAMISLLIASPWMLMLALVLVWLADSGAYLVGKRFGRVKLAPKISPGKTWEGVLGGLTAVTIVACLIAAFAGLQLLAFVPLSIAVASISIIGDLTVSMFKRDAGIKDSGTLFPGHGGVLDRIDSIAAAAPLFAIGISWVVRQ